MKLICSDSEMYKDHEEQLHNLQRRKQVLKNRGLGGERLATWRAKKKIKKNHSNFRKQSKGY